MRKTVVVFMDGAGFDPKPWSDSAEGGSALADAGHDTDTSSVASRSREAPRSRSVAATRHDIGW
jgi:hypothetical protein